MNMHTPKTQDHRSTVRVHMIKAMLRARLIAEGRIAR